MIRDRCPHIVDLALKWCTEFGRLVNQQIDDPKKRFAYKVKSRWIERVYQENVAIYTTKDEKDSSVRKALGIHRGKQVFNFADSINLESINKTWNTQERKFWIWVNSWVNWFADNYKYVVKYLYKTLVVKTTPGNSTLKIKPNILKIISKIS